MQQIAADQELMALVIKLNTQEQLYKRGIDSTGTPLDKIGGVYARETVRIKQEKGQEADFVTLKDTGEFYRSFRVFLNGNSDLEIVTDPIKDGVNLFARWGEDVVGLTQENLAIFREACREKIITIVRNELKIAA